MATILTLQDLVKGVEECIISAEILNAKLNLMHRLVNQGTQLSERVPMSTVKHMASDLYSALDRTMVAIHVAATQGAAGLDPGVQDVSNIKMWYSYKICKPGVDVPDGARGDEITTQNRKQVREVVDKIVGQNGNSALRVYLEGQLVSWMFVNLQLLKCVKEFLFSYFFFGFFFILCENVDMH